MQTWPRKDTRRAGWPLGRGPWLLAPHHTQECGSGVCGGSPRVSLGKKGQRDCSVAHVRGPARVFTDLLFSDVRAGQSVSPDVDPGLAVGRGFVTQVLALAPLALTSGPPALLPGWPGPGPGHHDLLFPLPPQHLDSDKSYDPNF